MIVFFKVIEYVCLLAMALCFWGLYGAFYALVKKIDISDISVYSTRKVIAMGPSWWIWNIISKMEKK